MRYLVVVLAVMLSIGTCVGAPQNITCVTDKTSYSQGEKVLITVTNNSKEILNIPDYEYIDGHFARPAVGVNLKDTTIWKTMKMPKSSGAFQTKSLKQNESHVYAMRLLRENEHISTPSIELMPNTYKVIFHTENNQFPFALETNEFTVKSDTIDSK